MIEKGFRICLLVSGNLGYKCLQHLHKKNLIIAVFTDKHSSDIISFAKKESLELFTGNPNKFDPSSYSHITCDILLSVNYLFIINKNLIELPQSYSINIHGSLLPKYRGRTPHVWSIINGETYTGITAHLIEEGVDCGDILNQIKIPIDQNATGADLLNIYNEMYIPFIEDCLDKVIKGDVALRKQDESKATYFGKRTAEDGRICWKWQKQRIRNWIRAQAHPYPGAFFFYNNLKAEVHHCEFSDAGFSYTEPDGLILKALTGNSIIVKVQNGAILLSEIKSTSDIFFKEGEILE